MRLKAEGDGLSVKERRFPSDQVVALRNTRPAACVLAADWGQIGTIWRPG